MTTPPRSGKGRVMRRRHAGQGNREARTERQAPREVRVDTGGRVRSRRVPPCSRGQARSALAGASDRNRSVEGAACGGSSQAAPQRHRVGGEPTGRRARLSFEWNAAFHIGASVTRHARRAEARGALRRFDASDQRARTPSGRAQKPGGAEKVGHTGRAVAHACGTESQRAQGGTDTDGALGLTNGSPGGLA